MATDRPRVQAYIDPELHQRFAEWKLERGIARDSEALNGLLAEYFGVSSQSPIPNPQSLTEEKINGIIGNSLKNFGQMLDFRLDTFQAQIDTLKQTEEQTRDLGNIQFLNLRIESLEKRIEALEPEAQLRLESESLNATRSSSSTARHENIEPSPEAISTRVIEACGGGKTQGSEFLKSLNGSELARRLRVAKSVISSRKTRADFEEWSKGKDPSGIAWRYDRKSLQFFPVPCASEVRREK